MNIRKTIRQAVSLMLVCCMVLPSTGCAEKKNNQAVIQTDAVVSFENDAPKVELTASSSCFKNSISETSLSISKLTGQDMESESAETVSSESATESKTYTENEASELTVSDVVYTDDKSISFVVSGDIDYDANYMLNIADDATITGNELNTFIEGTQFVQEITPIVNVESVRDCDENPVFEVTFQHGTVSPALDINDIYMEQSFSNLVIDKVVLTTGSVLTIYTKGTSENRRFEQGQIRFSPSVFLNYYSDVVAEVNVEKTGFHIDKDSLSFDNGTIRGKLLLTSGNLQKLPVISTDNSEVTVTSEEMIDDRTGVIVSISTNQTDIDAAYAEINGITLTIPAEYLSIGTEITETLNMPTATINTHIDSISEENAGYKATATLFANAGTIDNLSAEDVTISGDFSDAKVVECKSNDYGYEIIFTFNSEKGIDETTLNGTLQIADGKLLNNWKTVSAQSSCNLYYSTEGDRAEAGALDKIKAFWSEYGDTISTIPSVYSAAITALETFGVLESNEDAVNRKLDNIQGQLNSMQEDIKYVCQTVNKLNTLTSNVAVKFDQSGFETARDDWESDYKLLIDLQSKMDKYSELSDSYVDNWLENVKVIHMYKDEYGNLTYPVQNKTGVGYNQAQIKTTKDIPCKDIAATDMNGILSYLQSKQVHTVTFDNGVQGTLAGDNKTLTIVGNDDNISTAEYTREVVDALEFSDGTIITKCTKINAKSNAKEFALSDGTACYNLGEKVYRADNNQYIADYFTNAIVWDYNGKLLREVSDNFMDSIWNNNIAYERVLSDGSIDNNWLHLGDGVTTMYHVNCIVYLDGIAEIVDEGTTINTVTVEGKGTGYISGDGSVTFPDTNETATLTQKSHSYIVYADGTKTETNIVDESYENNADEIYEAFLLEMNYEIMNKEGMNTFDTTFNALCKKISGDDYLRSFFNTYYSLLSYIYNFDSQAESDKEDMRVIVEETLRKAQPLASLCQEFQGITIKNQRTLRSNYENAMEFTINTLDEDKYNHKTADGEAYCYVSEQNLKLYTLEAYATESTWKWYTEDTKKGKFGFGESGYSSSEYEENSKLKGYEARISIRAVGKKTRDVQGGGLRKNFDSAMSSDQMAVMSERAKLRDTTLHNDLLTVYGITDTKKEFTKVITTTSELKYKAGGTTKSIKASDLKGVSGSAEGKLEHIMGSSEGSTVTPRDSYDAYVQISGSVYDTLSATQYDDYNFGALVYFYTKKGYEEWCAYGNHAKYLLLSTN